MPGPASVIPVRAHVVTIPMTAIRRAGRARWAYGLKTLPADNPGDRSSHLVSLKTAPK